MGYALLWLVTLVLALLLAATLLSCAARLRSRGRRAFWSAGAVLLPLLGFATLTAVGGVLQFEVRATAVLFWPLLAISLVHAVGGIWLLRRALRVQDVTGGVLEAGPEARLWSRGKLAVATTVAAVLALITFWSLDLAQLQRLAVLRAEVGTLALSALPARVPARENAALVYERAFDAMLEEPPPSGSTEGAWQWRKAKGWDERFAAWAWPEAEEAAKDGAEGGGPGDSKEGNAAGEGFEANDQGLRKFLETQAAAVALFLEGASRPECSFEHDYIWPSFSMLLPELFEARTASAVLILDARVRAADGDIRGALERLNAVLRLGDHVGRDPTIINVLAGVALERTAFTWIPRILAPVAVDEEALGAIRLPEDSVSCKKRLRQALRMEEAFCLATLCDVAEAFCLATIYGVAKVHQEISPSAISESCVWPHPLGSLYRVFLLREDIAAYRSSIGSYQDLVLLPYPESKEKAEAVEARWHGGTRGLLAQLVVPGLIGTLRFAPEADARRACLRAYVAALRHRARTGSCPETLDALVPELLPSVPLDPFDGKPLKYRRQSVAQGAESPAEPAGGKPTEEFVVYSIGRDLKDDGGASYDEHKGTGDIAIRWGRRSQ